MCICNCQTLPYMTEVITCTFSLQLQTVMHTHTITGLRLKTPMRIPAEEGQLHLGFVHSLIKRPSWKQKCANHTDWGVPKQTQGITTTGRTLNLWSINKPHMLSGTIVISNSTKSNVMRYRTNTISQKHAYRYGFSPNAKCSICPCRPLLVRFTYSQIANTPQWVTWLKTP